MAKVPVYNKAAGPRSFNVKGAAAGAASQVTLMPGESAELELLSNPEEDPVYKGWSDSDEVLFGGDAKKAMKKKQAPVAELMKRQAELRAELASLEAMMAEDGDAADKTPPHQFGGDGGPEQVPTVDGRSGDPTPAQEAAERRGPGRPRG